MESDVSYVRMREPKYAPGCPFCLLERRLGLVEIGERGSGVPVEGQRVIRPQREHEIMIITENASRHWHHSAQQQLGFFEAP